MTDRRDHESRSTDETGTGHAQGAAFDSITNAPRRHLLETYPRQRDNGDERRYHDKRAGFFKCLPQDDRGEVDRDAYAMLLPALQTGEPADFEEISLSPDAERRLANPQAAYAFDRMSRDSWAIELPPAPRFDSPEMAAEIGEVYWQALTREVPFVYFDDDPNIADAINDLNGFSDIRAPTDDGTITPQTLFRGGLPGDLVGPYLASSSGSTSLMARRPSSRGIRFRKLVWIS